MRNHLIRSEHDIQTAILNYLAYADTFAWRNNSGMIAIGEGQARRSIRLGKAGMPDILGVFGPSYTTYGRLFGIEVKRPGQKATLLQQRTLGELASFGAIVFVADSADVVMKVFEKFKQ